MKPKKITSLAVRILLLTAAVTLLAASLFGCGKNMEFDDEDALKKHVVGTWTGDDADVYYVFTDSKYFAYSFDHNNMTTAFTKAFGEVKNGDAPIENVSFDSFAESFHETWLKTSSSTTLTWKYKKGTVSTYRDTFNVTEDGKLQRKSDGAVLTKLSDDVGAYEEKWSTAVTEFADKFSGEQKKIVFEQQYSDLPSGTDVQYDKLGHVGRQFVITGTAELDDYYNWGYRDLEGLYFCIRIRPKGGNLSNEWYVYGSRTTHKDLYDKLMSSPGKSVTLICTLYFYDTGSNNMATLFDYTVN